MKKYFSFFLLLTLLSVQNYCQAFNGYIILNTGEKMDVTIKISDGLFVPGTSFYDLQWKIKYYDQNDQKQKIKISLVKELYFKIDTNEYKMLAFKNTMKVRNSNLVAPKYVLLNEVQKGTLSNYQFMQKDAPMGAFTPHFNYHANGGVSMSQSYGPSMASLIAWGNFTNVLVIEGKPPIKVTKQKFKKPLLKYLATCKAITIKIENETYGKKDLIKIVDEYNNVCN